MEKAMAPHSSTLAWKIPWMEEPGGLLCMVSHRVGHDWATSLSLFISLSCIGEGNGNPLQCSCLENPRDGGAWWAAFYGVTQSRTRLKWLKWLSTVVPGGFIQAPPQFITNLWAGFPHIPKMWFAGREILGNIHKEQLGSNFRSCSCTGKLREL